MSTQPPKNPLPYNTYEDEISLRDLYLIFRKGLPFIIIASLLAAVAVFAFMSLRPAKYQASSTTSVSPLNISINDNGSGISFTPQDKVSLIQYQEQAHDSALYEVLMAAYPALAPDGVASLDENLVTKHLEGGTNARTGFQEALVVEHVVTHQDPSLAAEIADFWANLTLEQVQNLILTDLENTEASTKEQLAERKAVFDETQENLRIFNAENNLPLVETQVRLLTDWVAVNQDRRRQIDKDLIVAKSKAETLQEQILDDLRKQGSDQQRVIATASHSDVTVAAKASLAISQSEEVMVAREGWRRTREQLLEFNQSHNLDVLLVQIGMLRNDVSAKTVRLMQLPALIAQREEEVKARKEQLTSETQMHTLEYQLEVEEEGSTTFLQDAVLVQQALNPVYLTLSQALATAQTNLTNLGIEKQSLEAELAQLEAHLKQIRDRYDTLLSQQQELQLAFEQANDAYRLILQTDIENLQDLLRQAEKEIVSLAVEQEALVAALEGNLAELADLRMKLATLQKEFNQLTIANENAERAYKEVEGLEPSIRYYLSLAPKSTQIISHAAVPTEAISSRLLPTVLGLVLGGFLATLFVFLREAVKEPEQDQPLLSQPLAT